MSTGLLERFLVRLRPRWSPTAYKAFLVGLFVAAVAIPLLLAGLPFIEFLNDMAAQPKAKAQMTYGRVFGEQDVVGRDPPPGTVPRDYAPYAFADEPADVETAKRVGPQLANPVPLTMEAMRRGRDRFETFCLPCHGARAKGDGPATGPNRFPAPPSLHTDQARGYADGTIFHIITKGTAKMPSYADKLTPAERWMVIDYVRALQRAESPKPGDFQEQP